jgi:uncharacterized protein (TIGR00303 family)
VVGEFLFGVDTGTAVVFTNSLGVGDSPLGVSLGLVGFGDDVSPVVGADGAAPGFGVHFSLWVFGVVVGLPLAAGDGLGHHGGAGDWGRYGGVFWADCGAVRAVGGKSLAVCHCPRHSSPGMGFGAIGNFGATGGGVDSGGDGGLGDGQCGGLYVCGAVGVLGVAGAVGYAGASPAQLVAGLVGVGGMIQGHHRPDWVQAWGAQVQGQTPGLVCVLGFTETALIPGISAAGATPVARRTTAAADAEFLLRGAQPHPVYPLPPLYQGASPVYISHAIVRAFNLPVTLVNTGLPVPLSVPAVNLGQTLARCVSTGQAMDLDTVHQLWQKGWDWGQSLLASEQKPYYILGECVVGGTTTALAVLTGLGVRAQGRVSSSHPQCNHAQKWQVVQSGLQRAGDLSDPWAVVAAVGDPMQVVVAAVTLALHRDVPILLAGGTQMLAVWGLIQSIAAHENLPWQPERVLVGTTGWVVHDPSAEVIALAQDLGAPLVSADLDFSHSQYKVLRVYEQGFVKEGVAAGGCALSAHWYCGWGNEQVLTAIESLLNAAGHSPDVPAPSAPPLP